MEINVTIGDVQLCFIASPSSSSSPSSSTPPKIHTTKNDLEKTVELSNFTGTIKIKSIDGTTPVKAKLENYSGKQDEQRKRLARIRQSALQMSATYGIDPSDTMTTPLHICCASR